MFCPATYGELSRFFFSGFARCIFWIYCRRFTVIFSLRCRTPVGELCIYFLKHLTELSRNIVGDSQWTFSLCCRVSHGELCRYFPQHFTANYVDILPVISRWLFSLCCLRATVNFRAMLSGVSRWIIYILCSALQYEFPRCFVAATRHVFKHL
jgi:hypothetical protein